MALSHSEGYKEVKSLHNLHHEGRTYCTLVEVVPAGKVRHRRRSSNHEGGGKDLRLKLEELEADFQRVVFGN